MYVLLYQKYMSLIYETIVLKHEIRKRKKKDSEFTKILTNNVKIL